MKIQFQKMSGEKIQWGNDGEFSPRIPRFPADEDTSGERVLSNKYSPLSPLPVKRIASQGEVPDSRPANSSNPKFFC